jgi:hypothetical protein
VNRHAAAQIGKRKVRDAVAAERGAEQAEERDVLIDGEQLPVAKRPADRRKIEANERDFADLLVGVRARLARLHGCQSCAAGGECEQALEEAAALGKLRGDDDGAAGSPHLQGAHGNSGGSCWGQSERVGPRVTRALSQS